MDEGSGRAAAAGSILALCIAHCAAVEGVAGQQLRYTGLPCLPPSRLLLCLRRVLQKKFTKNQLKKFSISRIVWVDFLCFSFFFIFFFAQCAAKTFAKMLQKYEMN